MSKYFANNNDENTIKMVAPVKVMEAEIKKYVTIPMYFYQIIVPQMGSYYDNYPVDFDNKIVVCCPLHDEDTPSCRYYEDTNSFYCFGCQRGGDVVQLHRYFAEKMNGNMPDRQTAVQFIYDYFIKGKDTANFIDVTQQHIQEEKLNSDADIVKLNLYRFNLERSITYDNHIKFEIKQKLWKELDMIDCLISKNLIKATEAEQHLKQKVKELITFDNREIMKQ